MPNYTARKSGNGTPTGLLPQIDAEGQLVGVSPPKVSNKDHLGTREKSTI